MTNSFIPEISKLIISEQIAQNEYQRVSITLGRVGKFSNVALYLTGVWQFIGLHCLVIKVKHCLFPFQSDSNSLGSQSKLKVKYHSLD